MPMQYTEIFKEVKMKVFSRTLFDISGIKCLRKVYAVDDMINKHIVSLDNEIKINLDYRKRSHENS